MVWKALSGAMVMAVTLPASAFAQGIGFGSGTAIGTGVGAVVAGPPGAAVGAVVGLTVDVFVAIGAYKLVKSAFSKAPEAPLNSSKQANQSRK